LFIYFEYVSNVFYIFFFFISYSIYNAFYRKNLTPFLLTVLIVLLSPFLFAELFVVYCYNNFDNLYFFICSSFLISLPLNILNAILLSNISFLINYSLVILYYLTILIWSFPVTLNSISLNLFLILWLSTFRVNCCDDLDLYFPQLIILFWDYWSSFFCYKARTWFNKTLCSAKLNFSYKSNCFLY
jgi:hypothetical protein